MTLRTPFLALAVAAALLSPGGALACTSFCLVHDGGAVVGKNYDWNIEYGLVLVNKRNVERHFDVEGGGPSWVSRYGSLTFNQYGRDLPQGGVNEAGLAVEILWLEGTEWAPADDRPALGATQWIQYQLDTAADVSEVLASFDAVRIESGVQVHYFVTDREGRSATVEFLGGKLVAHTGDALPARTLTNDPYETCAEYLRRHRGWGGDAEVREGSGSRDRFVRASTLVREFPGGDRDPVDYAFTVLERVAQGENTRWSIVYDLENLRVHFRSRLRRGIKTVDLVDLDFTCSSPVRMLNVSYKHLRGSALRWRDYSRDDNRSIIEKSYRNTSFLRDTADERMDIIARYPETSRCAD